MLPCAFHQHMDVYRQSEPAALSGPILYMPDLSEKRVPPLSMRAVPFSTLAAFTFRHTVWQYENHVASFCPGNRSAGRTVPEGIHRQMSPRHCRMQRNTATPHASALPAKHLYIFFFFSVVNCRRIATKYIHSPSQKERIQLLSPEKSNAFKFNQIYTKITNIYVSK